MAATIVSDAAVAAIAKEEHLVFPIIAVERPAMREDNDWTSRVAPVLVKNFGLVFGGDERHDSF